MDLTQQFLKAKKVGTPLIGIETFDQRNVCNQIVEVLKTDEDFSNMYFWDCVSGAKVLSNETPIFWADPSETMNLTFFLESMRGAPDGSTVFVFNAHRQLTDDSPNKISSVNQVLFNLRDEFKMVLKTVVLLGPSLTIPGELKFDILTMDDPLPTREAIKNQVEAVIENATKSYPDLAVNSSTKAKAIDELVGLTSFQAEQSLYLALTKESIDLEFLADRRIKLINQTPGLKVHDGGETFEDIGGCDNVKYFMKRVINGKDSPKVIVFIDEGEKMFAGAIGSVNDGGVAKDSLGATLAFMEDNQCDGATFVGPPGTAKSAIAKSVGAYGGIPTITLDLGAVKDGLVGSSEKRIREAFKVIHSIGDGKIFFIMTCNKEADLPPELKRRFTSGTFFFDLPTAQERHKIWYMYIKKYNLPVSQEIPKDVRWTGAEIRNCCRMAYRQNISLVEAATFIVPIAISNRESIEELRSYASGRFLSASSTGIYRV